MSAPPPDDDVVVAATRRWIERAVIGLNLCPFARAPYVRGRVRFVVSAAETPEALLEDLRRELVALHEGDAEVVETTVLVHPHVLGDFLDYNDFLGLADIEVAALGLEGELQLASFHPDYCFAGTDPADVTNATNRSPYPTLHLLREASIARVVDAVGDTDAIVERNLETLRGLGFEGWEALWRDGGATRAP